jgi:enamine deaminase RidA (YjgF/YER057c/UK114 family)
MPLKIERFQPDGMHVRTYGDQPAYSHVVTVSGAGKIVYIAGQLARDIDGNCVGIGDMRAQMEQTFRNLDRCLKAAGATWADVVKTNTYVTDFDAFQKCSDVRMRYFEIATPTSTTVGVTRLAGPHFMVEIEAVAVVADQLK